MNWQNAFSILVLASCFVIYWYLIRPKLHAIEMLDPYFDAADERYARWWAKLRGWRVEAMAFLAITLLQLPEIIDFFTSANVMQFIPEKYQHIAQLAPLILALLRAFVTKRSVEEKVEEKKEAASAPPGSPSPAAASAPSRRTPGASWTRSADGDVLQVFKKFRVRRTTT